jgi:hypothetical protein
MPYYNIILLMILHFIADFILQSDWMAQNKSKYLYPLFVHCITYASCFLFFGPIFGLITFICHFITDFFTSKLNSYLYTKNRHWFFVGIGADQLIHNITLILTYVSLY